MSLEQAIDWIVEETIEVLRRDDPVQRGQWSQALDDMHGQVEAQPEMADFAALVDAVREWVEGHQATGVILASPFDAALRRIEEGLGA